MQDYDLGDDPDDPHYFRSFDAPRASHEYTAAEALQALSRVRRPTFPAGDYFEYSNSGYMVLAQIIERVSGQRYADFLKQEIFDPLGMHDTLVLDERRRAKPPSLALGYAKAARGWLDVSYFPTIYVYGQRGVISTINDMYKWDQALYTDRLVSQSSLDLAFTPVKANDGQQLLDPEMTKMMKRPISYGFGRDISSLGGEKVVEHTGRGVGYSAYIMRVPSLPNRKSSAAQWDRCPATTGQASVRKRSGGVHKIVPARRGPLPPMRPKRRAGSYKRRFGFPLPCSLDSIRNLTRLRTFQRESA